MKYVKMWDNIYAIDKITEKYACIHDTDGLTTYHYDIRLDNNNARFSDTIKELCDTFVFKGVDETPLICDSYDELIYWFNHSKEEQYTTRNCYGAIWTRKGLLYIAKMNENGELELM